MENIQKKERILAIDALRGFAVMGIILLHNIEHFNFYIDNMIYWSKNNNPTCSVPAYKCALVAAEAVNQMVQYFDNNKYASIDSELKIDIYHHKYIQSDRFGIF